MSWDLLWWAMGVLIVILIAASLVSTTAHQKDPVSPAGSSWPSTNPGSRESVNPVVDSDVGVRAPWVRSAPGALLAGQQAELAVRNMLVDGLPAGTWVLSGLTLPGLGGDIDLLIVGALGAVVLEVKYWAGRIVCGQAGHAWARGRRGLIETMSDPARQLEGEVAALTAFWKRNGYSVASAMGGLLVFGHPRCRLEVAASRVPIARPGRALQILRGCQAQPRLSEAEQAHLVELVVAAQPPGWYSDVGVRRALGTAGGYTMLEDVSPDTDGVEHY